VRWQGKTKSAPNKNYKLTGHIVAESDQEFERSCTIRCVDL